MQELIQNYISNSKFILWGYVPVSALKRVCKGSQALGSDCLLPTHKLSKGSPSPLCDTCWGRLHIAEEVAYSYLVLESMRLQSLQTPESVRLEQQEIRHWISLFTRAIASVSLKHVFKDRFSEEIYCHVETKIFSQICRIVP